MAYTAFPSAFPILERKVERGVELKYWSVS